MKYFDVLYEDNHLLIVNKAPGVLVQGDETGDTPLVDLLKQYIKEKYNKPGDVFLGVVHRLDRPVSGAVVFARTSKALQRMNALFRERETLKTYWALVSGRPRDAAGILVHWLRKDEAKNKTTAFPRETNDALRSELAYEVRSVKGGMHLLQVTPVTGRSHQIRVQLSAMGCPIVGDVKYGAPAPNSDGSICLHARQLRFVHPVRKEPLVVTAELPNLDLWRMFADVE